MVIWSTKWYEGDWKLDKKNGNGKSLFLNKRQIAYLNKWKTFLNVFDIHERIWMLNYIYIRNSQKRPMSKERSRREVLTATLLVCSYYFY